MERDEVVGCMFVGFVVGVMLFMVIDIVMDDDYEMLVELGGAVCEETYGLGSEFVSYSEGVLKCSDPVDVEYYDGIIVKKVGYG